MGEKKPYFLLDFLLPCQMVLPHASAMNCPSVSSHCTMYTAPVLITAEAQTIDTWGEKKLWGADLAAGKSRGSANFFFFFVPLDINNNLTLAV